MRASYLEPTYGELPLGAFHWFRSKLVRGRDKVIGIVGSFAAALAHERMAEAAVAEPGYGLASQPEELARIAGVSPSRLQRMMPNLRRVWSQGEDGRLHCGFVESIATYCIGLTHRRLLGSRIGGLTTQALWLLQREPRGRQQLLEWRAKLRRMLRKLLLARDELAAMDGKLGSVHGQLRRWIEELDAGGPDQGGPPDDAARIDGQLREAGALHEPPPDGSRSAMLAGTGQFRAAFMDRRGLSRAAATVDRRLRRVLEHRGWPLDWLARLTAAARAELTLRQRLGLLSWNALETALRGLLTTHGWQALDPPLAKAGR